MDGSAIRDGGENKQHAVEYSPRMHEFQFRNSTFPFFPRENALQPPKVFNNRIHMH
jgi:hypothetical protein